MTTAAKFQTFWWVLWSAICAGLPIHRALDVVAKHFDQPDDKMFLKAIAIIKAKVLAGGMLSEGLAEAEIFSSQEVRMTETGEQLGQLDIMMKHIIGLNNGVFGIKT